MATHPFKEQRLPPWQRAVLKVGSSLLAGDGGLSARHAAGIGLLINRFLDAGREVVLVSSGAVAAGRGLLHARAGNGAALPARQALAALGQTAVVALWQRFFDRPVAQVLLTHDDLRNRRRYLNARATLRGLLDLGALPVINENDTVAVDELKLGDNDNLAAHVAMLIDADLLILLSDVDGLYSADPRTDPAAVPIQRAARVSAAMRQAAGGAGSRVGTGGMATKLEAAARAGDAGVITLISSGTDPLALDALGRDRLRGTRIDAARRPALARKTWLKNLPDTSGVLRIDAGAARALRERGASLLARGLLGVEGDFARGDPVRIAVSGRDAALRVLARGLSQYNAGECQRLIGARGDEIASRLGFSYGAELVHRDDLVLLT